ncbi:MAG: sigma-70 family RNA polymerase sigma factor [Eubacteriales bacterium]|nr:sigma-70 family RNA polymerase sigma factor [Eubacteriales bacterium]
MQNEEKLIHDAKKGDNAAFEAIVKEYQNKIYTLCYRYTGNYEDARDLAQEVFIKVYRNIKKFEGRSSFSTWIYQVAGNTCKDYLRKIKNKSEFSLDEEVFNNEESFTPQVLKDENTPDLQYEEKERISLLKEAVNKLNPEYKMVIIMREFQDLSYEEIARETNTSIGTVKSRLSRGRNMLKGIFLQGMEGSLNEKPQLQ